MRCGFRAILKMKHLNFLIPLFLFGFSAQASSEEVAFDEFRNKVYESQLKSFKPYKQCVQSASVTFNLPEIFIMSALLTEGGTAGECQVINSNNYMNKTTDCGPLQINSIRASQLASFGISYDDVVNDACLNIHAGALLYAVEINKAGDFWKGVGNYHYSVHGDKPHFHYIYIQKIYTAWKRLTG